MPRLHAGMPAPSFRARSMFGEEINLEQSAGRLVLLSFFRNAACALCNLRIHHLIRHYPQYRHAGLEILAVFESPEESMRKYVGMQDTPFALIADPEARLYDLYGLETSAAKLAHTMGLPETQAAVQEAANVGFALTPEPGSNFERMPADFLIGSDGILLVAHYNEHVTDHLPFAVIEEYLG